MYITNKGNFIILIALASSYQGQEEGDNLTHVLQVVSKTTLPLGVVGHIGTTSVHVL